MTNSIYTKAEEVSGTISIWAVPPSDWEIKRALNAGETLEPFKYEMQTNKPWGNGVVEVYTFDHTVTIPAGINLLEKAIETMTKEQEKIMEEARNKRDELQQQIQQLQLLSAPRAEE